MTYIRGVDRKQVILFPEVIDDYIEEDNPVRFIDAFVESLDLKKLEFTHSDLKPTGRPPYNPWDMLKLYIYGYLNQVRSSRRLEKEAYKNVEVIWLLKKLKPDFKTIADFRKDNKSAIKQVCKQFTLLCKKLELFGGELVSIDGSKFKACNSKKRNFNEVKLSKRIREIEARINEYLSELENNDKKEANVSKVSAEELNTKIDMLKDRKGEYKNLLKKLDASGESQISLTDPDSRAMVNNQRIEVCYNVQVTVDDKHKLILDHEVTNEVKDNKQLGKMAKRAKEILDVDELKALADKGYYDSQEIKECVDNNIIPYIPKPNSTVSKKIDVPKPEFYKDKFTYDAKREVYLCPGGSELNYRNTAKHHGKMMRIYKNKDCVGCEFMHKCTRNKRGRIIYRWEHEEILEDMHKRVQDNKEMVRKRQWLSEHPFGTMKRAFNQGYTLMKGMDKVGAELSLTVLTYNIKRVINIIGMDKLIEAVGAMNKTSPVKEGKYYVHRTMDYSNTIKQVYVTTSHTV